jgi:prolyl-tRNA editing enzyme YbaK/EbsC (Cys-tRNA(Pro) deacylase)
VPTVAEVTEYLQQQGVPVQTYAEPTPTAATAARAVGCRVGEIAKTLLFIVGGAPVVVVTAGDQKVKGSKLKRATGRTGKVRLPDAGEVEQHTGYRPGGVCPFLLPGGLPVVVDRSLRRFETVYPAAGDDHTAVPVTVDRLLELTEGSEVDACDPLG